MAVLDLIKHRKSVRDFLDKVVERDKIMMCLEAARLAPSACNSQPWWMTGSYRSGCVWFLSVVSIQ